MVRVIHLQLLVKTLLTVLFFSLSITFISTPHSKLRQPLPLTLSYRIKRLNTSSLPPDDFKKLSDLNNFTFTINTLRCSSKFERSVNATLSRYFEDWVNNGQPDAEMLTQVIGSSQASAKESDEWDEILITFFIHSTGRNFENRMTIRKTWGKENNLVDLIGASDQVRIVFLVGESENPLINELVRKEATIFKDIIQGNFLDTYRNLTYKHLMGLKWVTYFCPKSQFVVKADDDIFLDVIQLALLLKAKKMQLTPNAMQNLLACSVVRTGKPKRSISKWQVSFKDYANESYPDYCNGWLIVMSSHVAFKLYSMSSQQPFFWIDDVLITGIYASRLGLHHQDIKKHSPRQQVDSWLNDPRHAVPPLFKNEISSTKIAIIWSKALSFYRAKG